MTRISKFLAGLFLVLGMVSLGQAQTTTTTTTLSAAITQPIGEPPQRTISVASATGFTAGTTALFVDRELMMVQAVSGTTITVRRGAGGLLSPHANATTVYVGPVGAGPFRRYNPAGSCTATNELYLPQINTEDGSRWNCINSVWTLTNGGLGDIPQAISGSGATVTLRTAQSGSTILLDRAAGIVFTLPAPAVGLSYEFIASVSVTSNAYKFSTATQGTDWIVGDYLSIDTDTASAVVGFPCNGSSHDNFSMNGTTTGGLIGTRLRLTAISTTVWAISGFNEGSGTVANACATS